MEQNQINFEMLYAKNQLIPRIKQEFINAGFVNHLRQLGIKEKFGLSLLVQMVLHKRANLTTMVGLLKHHFDTLQECADALLDAAKKDIVHWNDNYQQFIIRYGIDAEVEKEIAVYQFPLPMVTPPTEVKHNMMTGYITIPGSMILRDNHHEDDICLDHINKVNATELSLDMDVVAFVKNKWRDLDKQKPNEEVEDYKKRLKAFDKYDADSKEVIKALVINGNKFYLTHKYDKRGRTYAVGYHVNYMGNTWNKACVEFHEKEALNE